MKKIAFVVTLVLMTALGQAQEFYVRAGLGYAVPLAGQTVYNTGIPYYEFTSAYNGSRTTNPNGSESYSVNKASLSAGLQSVLGIGYMFTPNIGVQLDAGIGLANTKYTFNDENVPLNFSSGPIDFNISTVQQAKTPMFFMPSLVLQTNGDNKLNAYTRFGIVIPANTKVTVDEVFTNAPGTGAVSSTDFTWQIKNSFSLGFTAAAGVKYKISDRVSIWGELSIVSLSVYAKEEDLVNTSANPALTLGGPTTIKFSKTATVDSTYSQFPTYAQPFSNMGINVGVTFTISHHERAGKGGDEYIDRSKPFRRSN